MSASTVLNALASEVRSFSKRLLVSYVLDWIALIGIGAIAIGFHQLDLTDHRHAFSLQDPSISYPHVDGTVSNVVLWIVAIVVPAVIIVGMCLIGIPGCSTARTLSTRMLWRRKLWEWHAGWLGLALACASSAAIVEFLKPLAGRPRPHLLAVCDPDLSPEAIDRWRVGGLGGTDLESATPIVVTWQICQNTDDGEMRNAFASFPSGHSSQSWAGLLYLSLVFCAKFGLKVPFMHWPSTSNTSRPPPSRAQGAAPPTYLILLTFIPTGTALFISVSRWFDYRHHGFDIIAGSLIGIICASISFNLYHVPLSQGDGWAWGARARRHAFGLGVGSYTYADEDLEASDPNGSLDSAKRHDVEANAHTVDDTYELQRPGENLSRPA